VLRSDINVCVRSSVGGTAGERHTAAESAVSLGDRRRGDPQAFAPLGIDLLLFKIRVCLVGMEACATAHYWARELATLGHTVKLVPPACVEALRQARQDGRGRRGGDLRGGERRRPCCSCGQVGRAASGAGCCIGRDLLVRQRTMLANAIHGYSPSLASSRLRHRAHRRAPEQIILDLDASDDPLHGHQEGRFFHGITTASATCLCKSSVAVICSPPSSGAQRARALGARCVGRRIDASSGAVKEVERIIAQIRKRWPRVRILLRAGSG
jgi:hypothetical protein